MALALAVTLAHLALATAGTLHRDELYLLQHGAHAWDGSLDHAICTPLVARLGGALSGDAAIGLRLVPALTAGLLVLLVAACCARLGGDRRAQLLAGALAAGCPVLAYAGGVLGTNAIDLVVAATLTWSVLTIVTASTPTAPGRPPLRGWWLLAGAALALGLANKLSAGLMWATLLAASACTPTRTWLRTPWPYVATAIGALGLVPDLLLGGHPLALLRAHQAARVRDVVPGELLLGQLVILHPVALLAIGAAIVRARRELAPRVVVLAWAGGGLALLLARGKPYQWAPWAVALIAAGAPGLRAWLDRRSLTARTALGGLLALSLVASATFTVAPPAWLPLHRERVQFLDWPGLASQLATLRDAADLPRPTTVVTSSYGTAAAVERYGASLGLEVRSGANSYYRWSRPRAPGPRVVLWVGYPDALRAQLCIAPRWLGTLRDARGDNRYDVPRDVYACELRAPLGNVWHALRAFD